jgi:uncharacterized protein (TIGR02246 family)
VFGVSSALVAGVSLVACGGSDLSAPTLDRARAVDALRTDEVHWNTDLRRGDADKVAAHFTESAVAMWPGQAPVEGKGAIARQLQTKMASPKYALSFASDRVEVAESGDLAASHGVYSETTTDQKTGKTTTATGSFMKLYRRQKDGGWKVQWAIRTPDGSPAASEP